MATLVVTMRHDLTDAQWALRPAAARAVDHRLAVKLDKTAVHRRDPVADLNRFTPARGIGRVRVLADDVRTDQPRPSARRRGLRRRGTCCKNNLAVHDESADHGLGRFRGGADDQDASGL